MKQVHVLSAVICATIFSVFSHQLSAATPTADKYTDSASYAYESTEKSLVKSYDKMIQVLKNGFDDVCGDTFCEGDYSNLQSIEFLCGVEEGTGRITSCTWTFAGTMSIVNGKTGQVEKTGAIFNCPIRVNATLQDLIKIVNDKSYDFEETVLPGMKESVYDSLTTCI